MLSTAEVRRGRRLTLQGRWRPNNLCCSFVPAWDTGLILTLITNLYDRKDNVREVHIKSIKDIGDQHPELTLSTAANFLQTDSKVVTKARQQKEGTEGGPEPFPRAPSRVRCHRSRCFVLIHRYMLRLRVFPTRPATRTAFCCSRS